MTPIDQAMINARAMAADLALRANPGERDVTALIVSAGLFESFLLGVTPISSEEIEETSIVAEAEAPPAPQEAPEMAPVTTGATLDA